MVDLTISRRPVLILVLMEDGLGDYGELQNSMKKNVLILVLMEDGLGGQNY